jgi:ATP-binding cassette subfamily F protein 3
MLAGEDRDFTGRISYGAGIQPGYFSQEAAESMGAEGSLGARQVIDYLEAEAPTELIPRVRDMLGAFLFRGDDVYKPVSVLSGGEKSRLALLRMLLKPMNLLILDEPTNHLDIQSKDILLEALGSYGGTVIFVSHDRSFMEALSTKTLELSARGPDQAAAARLFYGGYGYYLDRVEQENGPPESGAPPPASPNRRPRPNGNGPDTPDRLRRNLIRRLEREEAGILDALDALEAEKTALETELAQPAVYSNGEKVRAVKARLDRIAEKTGEKSREWELKAEELEHARAGDLP